MRHPVSTIARSGGREGLRGAMPADVVGSAVLPAAPQDAGPRAGEDADGVRMATAAGTGALINEGGPARSLPRIIGEGSEGAAQALVAGPAEDDGMVLTGGMSDGGQAALGGELFIAGEAGAIVTELGEDLGGIDVAAAGKALEQAAIGVLSQGGLDGGGEGLDLSDERSEDGDESADDVAAGLGFGLADVAERGGAQAGEQLGDGTAAAVSVLAEELGEALVGQAGGALGRGVAGEEGEGDRGVEVGEDGGGAGPEALEQGAQPIGERHALGDEIVAAAHEGAQGAGLIGGGAQGWEAMAIGAQEIGQDEGVAGVSLAAGGGVARARGLKGVGMDGNDLEAGLDERVDEEARGPLQGEPHGAAAPQASQALNELRQAVGRVRRGALPAEAAGVVQDADSMSATRPVDADEESHCVVSRESETLRGERSGRSLTDWRSGLAGHVAHHPVAGLGLSFYSGERVSCWPSRGERTWLSPNPDHLDPLSALPPNGAIDFPSRGRVGQ